MAPRKRKLCNTSKNADTIKGTETSSVFPSAVKKSKIQSDQPIETNDSLVLNCAEHLEIIYSNLLIDTPLCWDEEVTCGNNDEFKNIIIEKESLNNREESNPSTNYNDLADLASSSNQNYYNEPVYEQVPDKTITDEEGNDEYDVDNLRTEQNENSDDLEESYSLITSSDEYENSNEYEQNEQEVISLSEENEYNNKCEQNEEVISLPEEDEDIECFRDDFSTSSSDSSFMDEYYQDVDIRKSNDKNIDNTVVENMPVENASVENAYIHVDNNSDIDQNKTNDVGITNAEMVIDLLDSDNSDYEEVYHDKDFVNLSSVEYYKYCSDPEYLRTIFPEFCSEMLCDLRSRFHKVKKSNQVLAYSGRRIGLTNDTIERVFRNDSWLNGDSINHYLSMLSRHRSDTHFSFDSYFLSDFGSRGYNSTKRRTEGVDIFSKKVVVFPVHLVQSHWALVYADMQKHILYYIDSLLDNYEAECEVQMNEFIKYLHIEHLEMKNEYMKDDWRKMVTDISPIQTNFIDCGVFVCLNAKTLILDKFPDFEQKDIPILRIKIIHEILSDRIIE